MPMEWEVLSQYLLAKKFAFVGNGEDGLPEEMVASLFSDGLFKVLTFKVTSGLRPRPLLANTLAVKTVADSSLEMKKTRK